LPTLPFWTVAIALMAWWFSLPNYMTCVTLINESSVQELVIFDDEGQEEAEDGLMVTIIPEADLLDSPILSSKQEQFISWL
jgi:hypothetical protein